MHIQNIINNEDIYGRLIYGMYGYFDYFSLIV